jgi:putative two-component system response regulator
MPDVVLTDWNMPEINGLDFIRYIRENETDYYTYCIIITRHDEPEDLLEGFESGADDYLTKPVNQQELILRMRAGERMLNLHSKGTLIFALAKLTETRDNETGEHLDRIRVFSRLLAEQLFAMGVYTDTINRRFIQSVYETSPLHDVGKVGIPDAILLKKGKLTKDEFEIIKQHTLIGYNTLISVTRQGKKSKYLEMAAEIACSHHEKWDGSGYPKGLSGLDIPLAARIVAMADVYDALRSQRVYKPAYSHEEARKIILFKSKGHFDPNVIEAFIKLDSVFREISSRKFNPKKFGSTD